MFDYITKGTGAPSFVPASPSLAMDSVTGAVYANNSSGQWSSAGAMIPSGTVNLATQSAAIAATTALTAPVTGIYEVYYQAKVTTVDAVSSTLGPFQVKYTDAIDSVVVTAPTAGIAGITQSTVNTTAGGWISGSFPVYAKAGTNIQYIMGYTSNTPGQMIYDLQIRIVLVG